MSVLLPQVPETEQYKALLREDIHKGVPIWDALGDPLARDALVWSDQISVGVVTLRDPPTHPKLEQSALFTAQARQDAKLTDAFFDQDPDGNITFTPELFRATTNKRRQYIWYALASLSSQRPEQIELTDTELAHYASELESILKEPVHSSEIAIVQKGFLRDVYFQGLFSGQLTHHTEKEKEIVSKLRSGFPPGEFFDILMLTFMNDMYSRMLAMTTARIALYEEADVEKAIGRFTQDALTLSGENTELVKPQKDQELFSHDEAFMVMSLPFYKTALGNGRPWQNILHMFRSGDVVKVYDEIIAIFANQKITPKPLEEMPGYVIGSMSTPMLKYGSFFKYKDLPTTSAKRNLVA